MSYFRNFPLVDYRFGNETTTALFQNLTTYIDIIDQVRDDLTLYEKYVIQDGVRPDVLSYELYGTIDFYWTFFYLNESLRIQGWPMNSLEVYDYAKQYYPHRIITTEDPMHGEFYVGDILANRDEAGDEFGNTFKARILEKNYDLGQLTVKPLIDVKSITLIEGGSGYINPPTVTISGGSGTGATAQAIMTFINNQGQVETSETVQSIAIQTGGEDFVAAPRVTISAPDRPRGVQATATATISGFSIPFNTDVFSVANQPNVLLWDEDNAARITAKQTELQYNAAHHYTNSAGERQDLTILANGGIQASSTLTKVTYLQRLININDELKSIKIFRPEVVSQINNEYQKLLRN